MRLLVFGLALAALVAGAVPGCASATPYKPDRQVVRSIPGDLARAELGRLLGRSQSSMPGRRAPELLEKVEVGPERFSFEAKGERFTFVYADVEPRAYTLAKNDEICVQLPPGPDLESMSNMAYPLVVGNGIIFVRDGEDGEKLLDALESLKAGVLAKKGGAIAPGPGRRGARSRGRCSRAQDTAARE